MPNLIDTGAAWLADQLKVSAGRTFVYRACTGTTATATGWRVEEDEQSFDQDGRSIVFRQHAIILVAADLGLEPRLGDTIAETVGTTATVWQVVPFGQGPGWKWEDAANQMVRIYVKQIEP